MKPRGTALQGELLGAGLFDHNHNVYLNVGGYARWPRVTATLSRLQVSLTAGEIVALS